MIIFEDHKFNWKGKIIVFLAIVIVTGIPWWISTYTQYLKNGLYSGASVIICAVCAGVLAYNTKHKKRICILIPIAAHQIAFFIKAYIDCLPDPTNHNLIPFEILGHLLVDGVLCLIIVVMAKVLKSISIKK